METLTEALERLARAGYAVDFFARGGLICCPECDQTIDPAQLVVDEVVRFEGESDPSEEVIVYALSSGPCGRWGTFTTAYGPGISEEDLAVAQVLRDRPHRHQRPA